MNDVGGERRGQQREQRTPAARCRSCGSRSPARSRARATRSAPACARRRWRLHGGREPVDDDAGQDAGEQTQRRECEHRGEREAVGLLRALGDRRARRGRETSRRTPSRNRPPRAPPTSASSAPAAGTVNFRPHCGSSGLSRIAWNGQPFGDEAVERRQGRDRHAADQDGERGMRHAVDQAAELLDVALAGRVEHRAGAEEQQALEHRVIEARETAPRSRRARPRRGMPFALKASARPSPANMTPMFSTVQ